MGKLKKLKSCVDINSLYAIHEYLNYSKDFFNNLDLYIDYTDIDDMHDLIRFYNYVRKERDLLKDNCSKLKVK